MFPRGTGLRSIFIVSSRRPHGLVGTTCTGCSGMPSLVSCFWGHQMTLMKSLANSCEGLTVGLVVVPQAMAYALLAQLSPEYGLYTSFTGAALYWLFGTSKDIVIGVSIHANTPSQAAIIDSDMNMADNRCWISPCWISRHICPRSPSWCLRK